MYPPKIILTFEKLLYDKSNFVKKLLPGLFIITLTANELGQCVCSEQAPQSYTGGVCYPNSCGGLLESDFITTHCVMAGFPTFLY
jgi:hypothetical protein